MVNLMLGDTDITTYVKPKTEMAHASLEELKADFAKLSKSTLECEKLCAKKLYQQIISANYPLIDQSFLSFKNTSPANKNLSLPKFSIYELFGENKFVIDMNLENDEIRFNPRYIENKHFSFGTELPEIFEKEILKVFDFGTATKAVSLKSIYASKVEYDYYVNANKKIKDCEEYAEKDCNQPLRSYLHFKDNYYKTAHYSKLNGKELKLTSQLNIIVPDSVKENVSMAEKHFNKNIYMIAETKPENWAVQLTPRPRISADPLVLGVFEDKCFLIDHFKMTNLEDRIRKEFLE